MWITRDELPTFLLMTIIIMIDLDVFLNHQKGQRLVGKQNRTTND